MMGVVDYIEVSHPDLEQICRKSSSESDSEPEIPEGS
jgi:hypothetical protein